MSLKSKFMKKSDEINADTKSFSSYLNLDKFHLNKWKFEKEEKDYLFDILPYKIETNLHPDYGKVEEAYNLELYVHSYIGINNNSYLCMKKMYGKPCAICEEFEKRKSELEDEGSLTSKEIWSKISELAVKYRILYHIKYKDKSYIFDSPYGPEYSKKISFSFEKSWKKALERYIAKGKDLFPIYLNEEDCTSLEFTYIPTENNFFEFANFEFPLIEDYNEKYVKDLISLERLLIIPDQEKIKNDLFGIEPELEQETTDDKETERLNKLDDDYYKEVVEPELEQETIIDAPRRKKKKVSVNICSYTDKKYNEPLFGINHDEFDDCDKCRDEHSESWEACKKEYEKE
jgi:hypothetical protein